MRVYSALGAVAVVLGLSACAPHGPGGVAYDTRGTPSQAVGGTVESAGGTVSGGDTNKEPRGNTPPGLDRDGHGPATGAIVDPTGAATGRKP
jgi:hypothetical protein